MVARRMTFGPFPPFTQTQLERRRPVWDALGDLYLDTDTRPDLPRMARVLAESGLSEAELNSIWQEEVTPALAFNLSVVAGEWVSFNLDWLEQRIVRRRGYRYLVRRWLPLTWLLQRVWPNGMQPYSQTVMTLCGELLALPELERHTRADLWQWIAFSYFWPDTPIFQTLPPGAEELGAVFAELEPHLRPLLNASDTKKMRLEPRRAHVLKRVRDNQ